MHSRKKTARRVLNDAQRGQFVNQGFVKFESAFAAARHGSRASGRRACPSA